MAEKYQHVLWPNAQGEFFDRAQTFSTTAAVNGWQIADTSPAGAPTYLTLSGGGAALTLASDSEAENVCLYQGDRLIWDIRELNWLTFWAKVSGIDAVTTLTMGLGSARNDTPDSVAFNAWFRMEGSTSTSNIVVESDDSVTDNDDKATGLTLSSTYRKFHIDCITKTDIKFYIDDTRVAASTTFTTAAYSSYNVQPIFQVQKASGAGVPAVTIGFVQASVSVAI